MPNYGKVALPEGRSDWRPVPLPEQVVLVTTVDAEGNPHIATKTRFTVVSYGPPTLVVFVCRKQYLTAENLLATREFVINVPGDDLVATSWVVGLDPNQKGPVLFEENGLTPIPSVKLKPPRIGECRAHLECAVQKLEEFGDKLLAYAAVVAVSMDQNIIEESATESRYHALSPFFFLEAGWTGPLGPSRPVEEPRHGPRHDVTILAVKDLKRSVGFYSESFGWSVTINTKRYVEFGLPGGRGLALCRRNAFTHETGAVIPESSMDATSGVQVYLRCDDLPRVIARLHTAGARPLSKVRERDWGDEVAYFADPDGHVIAVARPVKRK